MNKETEELKMLIKRFPLEYSEFCADFMKEKWSDAVGGGFDTVGMKYSFDLLTNTEKVRITLNNIEQDMRQIDFIHKGLCIENLIDYKERTILDSTYPLFTTFNLLVERLTEYVECEKESYSEMFNSLELQLLPNNIKYILDDICKQDTFSLELYLRYTSCISPFFDEFHLFEWGEFVNENTSIERAVEQAVHNREDDKLCSIDFGNVQLLLCIHLMLFKLAVNNQVLRKCSICGKYFVPANKSDEIYCRFPNDAFNGRTCKEESKKLKQYETEAAKGEEFKLAKNLYNRLLNADKRRNYTSNKTEFTESSKFRELNQEKKADVQQGTLSLEQYIQWLKEYDAATRKR